MDALVVLRGKEHGAGELDHALVERGDRFKVKVIGRLIEHQHVRARKHHAREHAAHLLASGKHLRLLERFLAGEEHTAQPAANITLVLALRELAQPVDEVVLAVVKILAVILREVALRGRNAPLEAALVRLQFAHENLEERGAGQFVRTDKGHLIARSKREGDVVEHLAAVDRLGEVADGQQIVADIAVRLPGDVRIAAGRRREVFHLQVIQQLLAAGRLTALAGVGREALNERLQFLDLLLVLLVDVLCWRAAICVYSYQKS